MRLAIQPAPGPTRIVALDSIPATGVRLGRGPEVEVRLPFATISGAHARLWPVGHDWHVEDLGSSNGTFVDGRRLAKGQAASLAPGIAFRIADVMLTIEPETDDGGAQLRRPRADDGQGGSGAAPGPESTATIARRLVADLLVSMGKGCPPCLVADSGPGAGATLSLGEVGRRYLLGRAENADLVLADLDASREHAQVERGWDGVRIRDLGSKNGIEIAGERVTPHGVRTLVDGDVMKIGSTTIRLDDPEERYLREMEAVPAPRLLAPTEPVPAPQAGAGSAASEPAHQSSFAASASAAGVGDRAEGDHASASHPPREAATVPSASPSADAREPAAPGGPPSRRSSARPIIVAALLVFALLAALSLWVAFGS